MPEGFPLNTIHRAASSTYNRKIKVVVGTVFVLFSRICVDLYIQTYVRFLKR